MQDIDFVWVTGVDLENKGVAAAGERLSRRVRDEKRSVSQSFVVAGVRACL